MDNDKYITLEQNIKKLNDTKNALVSLEEMSNNTFNWNRYPYRERIKYRKCIRRTKKHIKRLLVVIEKQSNLTK